eukprot:3058157-Rhodomonas_salina.3
MAEIVVGCGVAALCMGAVWLYEQNTEPEKVPDISPASYSAKPSEQQTDYQRLQKDYRQVPSAQYYVEARQSPGVPSVSYPATPSVQQLPTDYQRLQTDYRQVPSARYYSQPTQEVI